MPRLIEVLRVSPPALVAFRFWKDETPYHDCIKIAEPGDFHRKARGGEFYVQDYGDIWEVKDGDWVILRPDEHFIEVMTPVDVMSDELMFQTYQTKRS